MATNVSKLLSDGAALLNSTQFRSRARGFDRRPLIEMCNSLGGPRMMLLDAADLERLGLVSRETQSMPSQHLCHGLAHAIIGLVRYIPRSSEGVARDAEELIGAYGAGATEIFLVSHRWLTPDPDPQIGHPDNAARDKAHAVCEFVRFRRQWVQARHHFTPNILLWIDYACMDQDDATASGFALLPVWAACCERFLRFETDDYAQRAWCRLEVWLSYMFSFADHHVIIGPGYTNSYPHTGVEAAELLQDPAGGHLTMAADRNKVQALVDMAGSSKPYGGHSGGAKVVWGTTAIKCFDLRDGSAHKGSQALATEKA